MFIPDEDELNDVSLLSLRIFTLNNHFLVTLNVSSEFLLRYLSDT
jgi:hypothetical protein